MPGIVAFPTVVEEAVEEFGGLFANTPARWHLAEYLTGLMVADRKNVSAINAEFAVTTDQSCLNRWLTQVPWDAEQLNEHRLAWLQGHRSTRYSARGVIAIDNTLVDHHGKMIEDVGWFWDHADKRHLIAHDYVIANYVCASGKHYPLEFRRFRKRDASPRARRPRPSGATRSCSRSWWTGSWRNRSRESSPLTATSPGLQPQPPPARPGLRGRPEEQPQGEVPGPRDESGGRGRRDPPEDRKPIVRGDRKQWYFTRTVRLPNVDHPVRLAILWDRKNGRKPVKFLVTNRIHWEITRLLNVYRQRWTGTETFHRDGKQHLGLGDCQLRTGEGQTRHLYLVMLAHSLLMAQMQPGRASAWAHTVLTTIGEACRAVSRETLSKTLIWAIEQATTQAWTPRRIITYLQLA